MKRLLASTAIATIAFTAAASATSPQLERGLVRVEAHAFNERLKLAEPGGHLFVGNVKLGDLGFDAAAKIAPPVLSPFASILPIRFSTKLTLKAGVYALGVDIPNWHRVSRTPCSVKIDTADGDEIFAGVAGNIRDRKMGEKFSIEENVDLDLVYEIVCSYTPEGSGSLFNVNSSETRIIPTISIGDALPRPIAGDEIGIAKSTAQGASNSAARTIGKKKDAPPATIADGMKNGWSVNYRDIVVSPTMGNGTLDQRWNAALQSPPSRSIHANGPTMQGGDKAPNLAATHIELNSNLVVTAENAGTTWLALSAISRTIHYGFCWAEANVSAERIENETRHNIRAKFVPNVIIRADNKRQLVGAWLLPDLAPGAYPVQIVLTCDSTATPIAGSDVTILLRRPNDENLRAAAPAEFIVEK